MTSPDADQKFEQELTTVEQSLDQLKQRYDQVKRDRQLQGELQSRVQTLQQELKQIQQQLDTLEVELESRLFAWIRLQEPFWQMVRFGGLGVLLGWGLHWLIRR